MEAQNLIKGLSGLSDLKKKQHRTGEGRLENPTFSGRCCVLDIIIPLQCRPAMYFRRR